MRVQRPGGPQTQRACQASAWRSSRSSRTLPVRRWGRARLPLGSLRLLLCPKPEPLLLLICQPLGMLSVGWRAGRAPLEGAREQSFPFSRSGAFVSQTVGGGGPLVFLGAFWGFLPVSALQAGNEIVTPRRAVRGSPSSRGRFNPHIP